jgi:hypothetical protein
VAALEQKPSTETAMITQMNSMMAAGLAQEVAEPLSGVADWVSFMIVVLGTAYILAVGINATRS